jgi:hypothetical protein
VLLGRKQNKDLPMKTLISILGGAIWYDQGHWQTNGIDGPGDGRGLINDRFRVLAAAYLYQKNHANTLLLAQGGLATENRPSIASVMKQELEALSVPKDVILVEEHSFSTFSQLYELKHYIKDPSTQLFIVSNEWHLPRIAAMIQWIPELQELSTRKPQLCAAEEVLLQTDEKKWRNIIETLRQREDILTRISKEQEGVDQLKAGLYKYR